MLYLIHAHGSRLIAFDVACICADVPELSDARVGIVPDQIAVP